MVWRNNWLIYTENLENWCGIATSHGDVELRRWDITSEVPSCAGCCIRKSWLGRGCWVLRHFNCFESGYWFLSSVLPTDSTACHAHKQDMENAEIESHIPASHTSPVAAAQTESIFPSSITLIQSWQPCPLSSPAPWSVCHEHFLPKTMGVKDEGHVSCTLLYLQRHAIPLFSLIIQN